jgi:hypothetical protein
MARRSALRRCALQWSYMPKLQSSSVAPVPLNVRAVTSNPINDYYVFTSRRGEYPERWSGEIRWPLGVTMTGDGYQSDQAAQFAGKKALTNFLADLSKEEKRK